ncbi:MAG TPA: T9SS type A sorting domain-containing protein [Bacteroidia bacterium]|nr:T9SS type A sorting domain-containing protein [Bacteroidia bacterium]
MKKITRCLTVLILFFNVTVYAQFSTEWTVNYQHTTSNDFSNEGKKVVADAAGNAYVLADVTSDIDPNGNTTTSTFHYTVISKYSVTGSLLVSKSINVFNHSVTGFDNKGAFGLEMDAAGNIYIGYINYDNATSFDVNIIKYNSSLVRLWVRKFNSAGSDLGIDMGVSSAGVVYAIVKSISGANTGYLIIKANSQITNDTATYTFNANTDVLNAIWVEGNMVYVTGYHIVSGYKVAMTAKVNAAQGTLKWKKNYNGGSVSGDDFGNDIIVGIDGDVYVTGTSDQGPPTDNDVLIMKLQASNGVAVWRKHRDLDNSPADAGLFITAIDTDNVYVGSISDTYIILDQLDVALGKTGGRIAYQPIPDAQYSFLNGVKLGDFKISNNYGFYFTGSILATDSSNRVFSASYLVKFIVTSPTEKDAFKLESAMPFEGDYNKSFAGLSLAFDYSNDNVLWLTDGFSDYASHLQEKVNLINLDIAPQMRKSHDSNKTVMTWGEISIEPNPSDNLITVSSIEKIIKVELYDLTGKMVIAISTDSEKIKMTVSGLMNGMYIGKIYTESGTVTTRKIVKD